MSSAASTARLPLSLSARVHDLHPSPIREILEVVGRPGMISFAGGLPAAQATLRALQALTGGPTVELLQRPADADTGAWGLRLPQAAPVRASFAGGALGLFSTLRTELSGFTRTLRLHAAIDALRDLTRQVCTANAHILDGHAKLRGFSLNLLANAQHQLRTLIADDLRHIGFTEHAAHGGVQHIAELALSALRGAHGLVEA